MFLRLFLLLSLALISVTLDFDFLSPCFCLEVWAAACTKKKQLCVRTFLSFDTRPRIASALLSFPRDLCLSGFLFLPPFLPMQDFPLPFTLRVMASTSIESSSGVFPVYVVSKTRLLLK